MKSDFHYNELLLYGMQLKKFHFLRQNKKTQYELI